MSESCKKTTLCPRNLKTLISIDSMSFVECEDFLRVVREVESEVIIVCLFGLSAVGPLI
jgi:hypothetical protein